MASKSAVKKFSKTCALLAWRKNNGSASPNYFSWWSRRNRS